MSWIVRMTRKVLRIQAPEVTSEQALRIALEESARRGHGPLREPRVREGLRTWLVLLDPGMRPCRIVEIDNQTGQVRRYLAPPR